MRPRTHSQFLSWFLCLLVIPALTIEGSGPSRKASPNPKPASIVAMIAAPAKYDGQRIQTIGFLDVEFEGHALYLHEEDYRYSISRNAVELVLTKPQEDQFKKLSLTHVIVEGSFSASGDEMYGGSLRDITRLETWPPYGRR